MHFILQANISPDILFILTQWIHSTWTIDLFKLCFWLTIKSFKIRFSFILQDIPSKEMFLCAIFWCYWRLVVISLFFFKPSQISNSQTSPSIPFQDFTIAPLHRPLVWYSNTKLDNSSSRRLIWQKKGWRADL